MATESINNSVDEDLHPAHDEATSLLDNAAGDIPNFGSTTTLHSTDPEDGGNAPTNNDRQKFLFCLNLNATQLSWARAISGYLLIINAGLLFTLANVVQKIVAPMLYFWHLLIYRAIFQLVAMYIYVRLSRSEVMGPVKKRLRIVAQGVLGGCLLLCIFIAVKLVPLGNASAIFFCTPVFTFLFARFMLSERVGCYRLLISALMLAGVALITRPPFIFPEDKIHVNSTDHGNSTDHHRADEGFNVAGYLCAVAVPLLSAVVSILTRQLKEVSPSVLMFWFGVGALFVAVGGLLATHSYTYMFDYSPLEAFYILSIIILGIAGNVSYTFAVR